MWDRYNLTRLLNVMFTTYLDFDDRPQLWTWREVLEDPQLTADDKLDRVRALAAEEAKALQAAQEPVELDGEEED